jgi:carbamoyltransferase
MQSMMNRKIKFRESFRPFAPAVLVEHVDDWFERAGCEESPYMLLVSPVAKNRRSGRDAELEAARGLEKLAVPRSDIPAVTHVDYSARLQTVDRRRHPRFHGLLERFTAKTGCPVIINTSFNVRGEPIVCTPADAFRCFMATNIDALVLENFVLLKDQQANVPELDVGDYLREFALD